MSRVKKFATAAALILVASGAMASSFRVADQIYIPVAGHIDASGGTFISDVVVANMSDQPVTVSVIFTPTSTFDSLDKAPQYFNDMFSLQAHERREFRDFISAPAPNGLGKPTGLESFGSLIFNACLTGSPTACRSGQDEFGDHQDYRDISVTSRIYFTGPNAATIGTTAQFFPGIPWYNYVSMLATTAPVGDLGSVAINGLTQTGAPGTGNSFRGNVGVMNASQYSRTTLRMRLFQGSNPAHISEFLIDLAPLNHFQGNVGDLFPGASGANLYVTVEQIGSTAVNAPETCQPEGCPGFLAYGALLDNLSADPVTLEAIYRAPLYNAIEAIYGTASAGKPVARRIVGR